MISSTNAARHPLDCRASPLWPADVSPAKRCLMRLTKLAASLRRMALVSGALN
jgi:hypothetical protein